MTTIYTYKGALPDAPANYDAPRGVFFDNEIHWENEAGTVRRLLRPGQRCGLRFAAAIVANLKEQGVDLDARGYEAPEPEAPITPEDVAGSNADAAKTQELTVPQGLSTASFAKQLTPTEETGGANEKDAMPKDDQPKTDDAANAPANTGSQPGKDAEAPKGAQPGKENKSVQPGKNNKAGK